MPPLEEAEWPKASNYTFVEVAAALSAKGSRSAEWAESSRSKVFITKGTNRSMKFELEEVFFTSNVIILSSNLMYISRG